MAVRPVAFVLLLAACDPPAAPAPGLLGSPAAPAAPAVPGAPPFTTPGAEDCAARTNRLTARLALLPHAATFTGVTTVIADALPVSPRGLNVPEAGPVLLLGPPVAVDGLELAGGDDDARAGALAVRWSSVLETAALLGRARPEVLYVAGSAADTAERAVHLASKVPELELRLLVRPASPTPRPPPPPTPPHLEAILGRGSPTDPARRSSQLASAIAAAVGTCGPLAQVFSAIAGVSGPQRADLLRQGVSEALPACNCQGVDVDSLEALLYATMDPGPPLAWLPLPRTARGTLDTLAR